MKTITDIYIILRRLYYDYHYAECKTCCDKCKYDNICSILECTIDDMLKGGEYH